MQNIDKGARVGREIQDRSKEGQLAESALEHANAQRMSIEEAIQRFMEEPINSISAQFMNQAEVEIRQNNHDLKKNLKAQDWKNTQLTKKINIQRRL